VDDNDTMTMQSDDAAAGAAEDAPQDMRQRLRAAMARHGWSQADAAKRIAGASQTTLNQWLNGKYPGDEAAISARVGRMLAGLEDGARVTARRAASPGWMRTPTANTIWAMLTQAQHAPDMVVLAGAPGLGKTMTARAYAAAGSNVWIATMDPTMKGANAVLTEVACEMGVKPGSPTLLRRQIGERLEGSGGLIIVDEAQHPSRPALDMLRSLHDRYGVGVALLGNHGFYGGTAIASRADNFAQFFSRVGVRRRLETPADGDVAMLLDAWEIEDGAARKWLSLIAAKPGALRAVDKCIKAAWALAQGAGEQPNGPDFARHLKAAWAVNA